MKTTVTERVAALRRRRTSLGLTRLEVWAHPEDHQRIKELARSLSLDRNRNHKTPELSNQK